MIPARHTLTGKLVSRLYSGLKLNGAFREVKFYGKGKDDQSPVLLLANHFSWWDGFIQYRLNENSFQRKLYVMMLEEQLQKNKILNQCGCFSVNKNSRDMICSLEYGIEIMHHADNMLLIFPQGEIQSMHHQEIRFQSGISYLLKRISCDFQIVMNVNLVDYDSCKKPQLTVYYEILKGNNYIYPGILEGRYNQFYHECKQKQVHLK